VTYIAFVSGIVELRRKWTCTKLTNPTHETRKRDNPLLSHPQVVPTLYEFLSSFEHKIRYFKECW